MATPSKLKRHARVLTSRIAELAQCMINYYSRPLSINKTVFGAN